MVPAFWQPDISILSDESESVEAYAYPTPWAWAEMMTAIIRHRGWEHLLFQRYGILLKALTLGYLDLEIVDLGSLDLGRILMGFGRGGRYLGLLRTRGDLTEGEFQGFRERYRRTVWGATWPDTLVWPAPRCSQDDWVWLSREVSRKETEALQPWADLRALLKKDDQWKPEQVPWMAALDHMLGDRNHSGDYQVYHVHCRTVGPVEALFPGGETRPFYMPVHERNFAKKFLKTLTGTFHQEKDGTIVLKGYRIALPQVTSDLLQRAGAGIVRPVAGEEEDHQTPRIRLKEYFDALQSLYQALMLQGGDLVEDVQRSPYLYPDAVRVVVQRLRDAGVPDAAVLFSDRAFEVLFEQDIASLPRLRDLKDEQKDEKDQSYFVYKTQGTTAVFLEKYADVWFGDLLALGWVLWQFFTGAAYFDRGAIRDARTAEPLTEGLYAGAVAYERVRSDEERSRCRRLATLQRFVKAYQGGNSAEEKLAQQAAKVFARWAWGEDVAPNGPLRGRERDVQLGQLQIRLVQDET
jgi:hypothetical protein